MSHFAVIVITPPSTEDFNAVLARQLQPYHEFECTGTDDQYIQDVDRTEEALRTFNADKNTYYVNESTNERVEAYDERFYRDPTDEETAQIGPIAGSGCGRGLSWSSRDWNDGRGYRTKVHYLPEGWKEVEIPTCEMENFAQWIKGYYGHKVVPFGQQPDTSGEHKYGYTILDEAGKVVKTIDRTNPNKKWDYWMIGGRYRNRLLTKDGVRGDSALKGEIDFHALAFQKSTDATHEWNVAQAIMAGTEPCESWESVRERIKDPDEARKFYGQQPRVKAWREGSRSLFSFLSSHEDYEGSVKDFLTLRCHSITGFAVLKDGQWYERGSMGWWGCVSDEKDEQAWNLEVDKLIADLPDDHRITIVDCHI